MSQPLPIIKRPPTPDRDSAPPTSSSSEPDFAPRVNKYARVIKGVEIDFYDIARAFEITDPAIQHALKKLIRYGCGEKSLFKDVEEAIYSLERWQEEFLRFEVEDQ